MGCHPSHWLSYVSRWLKPGTKLILFGFAFIFIEDKNPFSSCWFSQQNSASKFCSLMFLGFRCSSLGAPRRQLDTSQGLDILDPKFSVMESSIRDIFVFGYVYIIIDCGTCIMIYIYIYTYTCTSLYIYNIIKLYLVMFIIIYIYIYIDRDLCRDRIYYLVMYIIYYSDMNMICDMMHSDIQRYIQRYILYFTEI